MSFEIDAETVFFIPMSFQVIGLSNLSNMYIVTDRLQKYISQKNLMNENNIIQLDHVLQKIIQIKVHHKATIHKNDLYSLLGKLIKNENEKDWINV